MKVALLLILSLIPLWSFSTDISQVPLSSSSVNPNIILGYDDSGSMGWSYLPDTIYYSSLKDDYHYNPLAYNPNREYLPWVTSIASDNTVTRAANAPVIAETRYFYPGSVLKKGSTYTVYYYCYSYSYSYYGYSTWWSSVRYPSGRFSSQYDCYSESGRTYTLTADYVVATGQVWRGTSYGYYYEIKDKSSCPTCAAASPCPSGHICKDLPSNMTSNSHVRQQQLYTSARSAGAQNYANWKKYYSTRQLTLASALSEIIPSLTNVNMGILRFNRSDSKTVDSSSRKMFDLSDNQDKTELLNYIYSIYPNGYTPTHQNLQKIGSTFRNSDVITHVCQKNAAFVLTDGVANGSLPSQISYSKSLYGSGYPYAYTYSRSLADIALAYYTINPKPNFSPQGLVPVDKSCDPTSSDPLADCNPNLHMNTYALTFGVPGYAYKPDSSGVFPLLPSNQSPYFWQDPTYSSRLNSSYQIDDLWHATINGRGLMFSADDIESLITSVKKAFSNIMQRSITQANIGLSNVNISPENSIIFVSSFDASDWSGDVKAFDMDAETGVIKGLLWSASEQLNIRRDPRKIILSPSVGWGNLDPKIQNYLIGDKTYEGTLYRKRNSLIGDAVNATPVIKNKVVYQASNDGMLHAYDALTGSEKWAYIPGLNIPQLARLADPNYTHRYFVDSTPTVGKYNSNDDLLLVGGLGASQFGYYALDITDANNPQAMWEFTSSNGGGTSINPPRLIKTHDSLYPYVVIVTSGYNISGDHPGYFWVLNPIDGSVIRRIETPNSKQGGVGLGPIAAFVPSTDSDKRVSYLYAGDEQGDVYKIDTRGNISNWRIFTFASLGQPITTKPELQKTPTGNPLLLIGTGRFLGESDKEDDSLRAFYAIQDNQTNGFTLTRINLTQLTALGGPLQTRTIIKPNKCTESWANATTYGWYFYFPEAGERMISDPVVSLGYVNFTTNVILPNSCTAASYSWILKLNTELTDKCFAPLTEDATSSDIEGLNKGVYLSDKHGTRPSILRLSNGKIIKQTQLVDGTIKQHELGNIGGATTKIRSIRELTKTLSPQTPERRNYSPSYLLRGY